MQEGRVLPLATRAKEPVDLANPPSELLKYRATYLVDQADEPKRQIPPTVCVHGKDDLMVPAALSRELVEKLKAVGVESEYFEAPGKNQCVFALSLFALLRSASGSSLLSLPCAVSTNRY